MITVDYKYAQMIEQLQLTSSVLHEIEKKNNNSETFRWSIQNKHAISANESYFCT